MRVFMESKLLFVPNLVMMHPSTGTEFLFSCQIYLTLMCVTLECGNWWCNNSPSKFQMLYSTGMCYKDYAKLFSIWVLFGVFMQHFVAKTCIFFFNTFSDLFTFYFSSVMRSAIMIYFRSFFLVLHKFVDKIVVALKCRWWVCQVRN